MMSGGEAGGSSSAGSYNDYGNVGNVLAAQALELYQLCDLEEKGFITKRDMQRLEHHMGLSPEQLEAVFDSLDRDQNGCLTLEEFTNGFGHFLGGDTGGGGVYEDEELDDVEREQFDQTLKQLGVTQILDDVDSVRELWARIRRNNPELLPGFEMLLTKVGGEITKTQTEFRNLESALQKKATDHEAEVRKLYDEMENQLMMERQRLLNMEREKERQLRAKLEREVQERDKMLQEILKRHEDTQRQLTQLNAVHAETAQEKERLAKEKHTLERRLEETEDSLVECQGYIEELNRKAKEDRRQRAKAAIKMSEGIALERETLVRQLDGLREMNKMLKDEKDEKVLLSTTAMSAQSGEVLGDFLGAGNHGFAPTFTPGSRMQQKRGSILSSYMPPVQEAATFGSVEDDVEFDEVPQETMVTPSLNYSQLIAMDLAERERQRQAQMAKAKRPLAEIEIQTEAMPLSNEPLSRSSSEHETVSTGTSDRGINGERLGPDGANEDAEPPENRLIGPKSPERMFKVVFVGDSGVGKSSILFRLCRDSFKSTFAATIGVDYQFKNLEVDGTLIALQLWDTAGQERFRSITKQYFRKADGVVVCYDVTSEGSFINVRDWMSSVEGGTEIGTAKMLLGNKCDLLDDDGAHKAVRKCDAENLANEFGAIFHEVSAKTGHQVFEAFKEMAFLLKDKEDKELKNAIHVTATPQKKSGCCPK